MKKIFKYSWLLLLFLYSCSGNKNKTNQAENTTPQVAENGKKIIFYNAESVSFFETENISSSDLNADMVAPAKVSATIIKSEEGGSQNLVLFENPDLASNYTQLIQHSININQIQNIKIKQRKTELERIKDMQLHGAASGKELLDAQTALSIEETNLANEQAAIIEHETKLKAGGFDPEILRKTAPGTAYIICDIPENQISKVAEGSNCILQFTAFPNEKFPSKIDAVADMIDQATRMVKLRVRMENPNGKVKAGMFATVSFGVNEGNNISVNKNSLITIQGRNYVFVKTNPTTFERKEVKTGPQIGERIIVYSGLNNGEAVAVKGVMQLKGLSFGY
ncbi:MAG: efflux RND transporter periplasmic adaptor subunit [Bacteroidia bacterium]